MSMEQEVAADLKAPVLTPVLNARCALKVKHVVVTAVFCGLLVLLNYVPLRNTDLWSHVAYGQWMLRHATLPVSDPLLPLAEGMPVIDSAWLSQVLLAVVEKWAGAEGLSCLFAITLWLTYVLLARTFYLQTSRVSLSLVGMLLAIVIGWSRFSTIRPEIFSIFSLTVLLWLLTRDGRRDADNATTSPNVGLSRTVWIAVPLLFLVWANLHGSFVCGLMVLGCYLLGQVIETAWKTRSVRAVFTDRGVRQWLVLTELAAAATLLNPYGMDLWIDVIRFSRNPILEGVSEWSPLVILGTGGYEFALAMTLLLVVLRHSRRAMRPVDVLLLAVFALAGVSGIRMMGWFAPIFAVVVMPQIADLWNRFRPACNTVEDFDLPPGELPPGRSWRYSLVCVVMVWVAFSLSGFSRPVLGGSPRNPASLYNDATPLAVTKYLRENPPSGQIYNPQWWGDWLTWDGPAGLRVFANTHVHLLPMQVWRDYRRISFAEPGWDAVLERYNVTTIVVDKVNQPELAAVLKRNPNWQVRFNSDEAQVLVRAKPASK